MQTLFETKFTDLEAALRHPRSMGKLPAWLRKVDQCTEVVRLIKEAQQAKRRSYAPYSHFNVGAAGLFSDNGGIFRVYTGANQENAAYSPTFCAECVAVTGARHDRFHTLHLMAVCGSPDSTKSIAEREATMAEWVAPCGRCRQVMAEIADPDCVVVLYRDDGQVMGVRFDELFPLAFGPKNLGQTAGAYFG